MDRVPGCPFCSDDEAVLGNEHAYLRFDKYPVTLGHALIITRRHVAEYFKTTDLECTCTCT